MDVTDVYLLNLTSISGEKEMKKSHLNEGKAKNTSKYKTGVLESNTFLKRLSKGIIELLYFSKKLNGGF